MKKIFLIVLFFLILGALFVPREQVFIFNPMINTSMSQNFSVDNFRKIDTGFSKQDVINRLGNPIIETKINNYILPQSRWKLQYSMENKDKWGDYAWIEYFIILDSCQIVIDKRKVIRSD